MATQLPRLLINYTNERRQLLFCEQVLVKEQQVYLSEGLLNEEVAVPQEGYGATWLHRDHIEHRNRIVPRCAHIES